jgi:hypothetical protein
MDVNTSSYSAGVWTFDASLRNAIGARRFAATVDGEQAGQIAIGEAHKWVWGWARAMRLTGACRGDVLRAVLDPNDGTAIITKGGRELWEQ